MVYFQIFILFALVLSVHSDRMSCDLPCPADTFSQDYSSQIYGSPLPVYPPLTVTVNYDKSANEPCVKLEKEENSSNLVNSILQLPAKIAETLTEANKKA